MPGASATQQLSVGQAAAPWLCIGRGWTTYVGPVRQNRPHSHQLVQIAWSTGAPFEVTAGPYAARSFGHVVDAGASHCLLAAEPVRLLFLDPAMPSARGWRSLTDRNACELTEGQVADLEDRFQRWVDLGKGAAPEPPASGERERAVADWLAGHLEQPVRASQAADAMGLSEGRFLHWFSESHGLPFRAHVRWLRIQKALRCLAEGASLTSAAHACGFSDSAHLSRTFAATFGIAPRGLHSVRISLSHSTGPDLAGVASLVAATK